MILLSYLLGAIFSTAGALYCFRRFGSENIGLHKPNWAYENEPAPGYSLWILGGAILTIVAGYCIWQLATTIF
jgi:hypothetical protein